jgi:hypothetical protein
VRQRVGEAEQDLGWVGRGEGRLRHPPMLRRERIKNKSILQPARARLAEIDSR